MFGVCVLLCFFVSLLPFYIIIIILLLCLSLETILPFSFYSIFFFLIFKLVLITYIKKHNSPHHFFYIYI